MWKAGRGTEGIKLKHALPFLLASLAFQAACLFLILRDAAIFAVPISPGLITAWQVSRLMTPPGCGFDCGVPQLPVHAASFVINSALHASAALWLRHRRRLKKGE